MMKHGFDWLKSWWYFKEGRWGVRLFRTKGFCRQTRRVDWHDGDFSNRESRWWGFSTRRWKEHEMRLNHWSNVPVDLWISEGTNCVVHGYPKTGVVGACPRMFGKCQRDCDRLFVFSCFPWAWGFCSEAEERWLSWLLCCGLQSHFDQLCWQPSTDLIRDSRFSDCFSCRRPSTCETRCGWSSWHSIHQCQASSRSSRCQWVNHHLVAVHISRHVGDSETAMVCGKAWLP